MDKLKNLAIHWQLIILVVTAGVLGYAFRYTMTSGIYEEAQQTQDQADALKQKNEAARIATQRIEEFRALAQAKDAEYAELKVFLPEQREITNVLQGLQDTARGSHLTLLRFSPKDDATQGFITSKPVEVEVSSSFQNLRAFYSQMARLPRIVSISDFRITQRPKQSGDKTLDSQFLLTAYYATPESVMKQQQLTDAAKAGTPGAKPANGGGAPPAVASPSNSMK